MPDERLPGERQADERQAHEGQGAPRQQPLNPLESGAQPSQPVQQPQQVQQPQPSGIASAPLNTASGGYSASGGYTVQADNQILLDRARSKQIAGTFDALLRTVRTQNAMAGGTVARTLEVLTQEPRPNLHIEATTLRVDDEMGLVADADHGRWLLPAFMSGLRRLQAQEDSRAEDLHALALELSSLKLVPRQLEQFADWLWSDGLEGFETELHTSFAEVLDLADDPARQRLQIGAVRSEMAVSLASDVHVTLRDLDAASLLQEFQTPLDAFTAAARSGRLGLAAEEADLLRKGVDETAFWVRQEISLALAYPALRKALPPASVARSLVRVAAESFDGDFLALVAALSQHPDEYAKAVIAALENEPVGDAIAMRAPLNDSGLQRLLHLLTGQSTKFATGIARGLCERAAAEYASAAHGGTPTTTGHVVEAATARLATAVGVRKYFQLVDVTKLTPGGRASLAAVAVAVNADAEILSAILATLPTPATLALVARLPQTVLPKLDSTMLRLLRESPPKDRTTVTNLLLAPERPDGAKLLVTVLTETHAEGWELRTVRLAAQAAVKQKCAEPLVTLTRGQQAPPDARLTLLEVLARSPLSDDVLKWKFSEWMDTEDMRNRLGDLRKEMK